MREVTDKHISLLFIFTKTFSFYKFPMASLLFLYYFHLYRQHNCNKTKIEELYKSCRTLAADQALLHFIHEHILL